MWLLGVLGDIGGFVLQAAALRRGSLIVVQPLLTTSLLFTLTLTAAWSHHPITRSEWVALVMVLAGLALFLATASPPDQPMATADATGWILCIGWVAGRGDRRPGGRPADGPAGPEPPCSAWPPEWPMRSWP